MQLCSILGVVTLLLPLWEVGCLQLSTNSKPRAPKAPRGLGGALRRHKRSWVWNQFFVLEEYTGNDPLYVGKVRLSSLDRLCFC
ncbi:hypothetical protein MATL_G00037730 [Megalops atlanticus]|uniref:Uncharacterized protein n=1 Tax=Megalops atlanticus TaxID=7932 RepID=A0A9D3QDW1_MEGAT|nr:hypothetical protein MATL_G00037730 [Megalops atlanticus]